MSDNTYTGEDFEEKVRSQVEFYFSDSNLQTDKFLYKIYQANDGWVELKTILTFSRMRQYRPEDRVIEALKKSDKLVLSPNNDTIRRKDPLKDFNEIKNNRKKNTVHIEGFDKEASQDDIEEFFKNKIFEHLPKEKGISSIRRIRSKAKNEFYGVVDVEFKTTEDAEFFLNNLTISYPQGIVEEKDDEVDKKSVLKKMSLLTFREMRESSKRFGVNDVTKRRASFNENRNGNKKFRKGNNRGRKQNDRNNEKADGEKKETEKKESETDSKPEAESKPETENQPATEPKEDKSNPESKPEKADA
ncbi:hypothetical protein HYPBUDRAFT_114936 [Hyphopichia burtonii NRRL Y-1933]|uniref:HTH La-type RNA-binding domain-containing protein n=1 Tax=Hyphopichia burtonii NRRL Y-1933 TaxID=984485 RepID=A0A1E4RC74_9ASCO|nr:hypothetical protein HYPBUDRAFT_114936 [Hyphopichia burtonii NRRL Y-1933]ODV64878.1 hypothetical protein HYPBUDRAFT_114936 [Hyphopichia burtonii NRRL Y-1933]